jgi:hypothetical protein
MSASIPSGGQGPNLDRTFIDVLHQTAEKMRAAIGSSSQSSSSQGRNYLVISGETLTSSPEKGKEVFFEDLTNFVEKKLKVLTENGLKVDIATIKKDLKVVGEHLRVRPPRNPTNAKFKMAPDLFQKMMGFLDLGDVVSSEKVSDKEWKKDINPTDQLFWKTKLKAITYGPEAWENLSIKVGDVPLPPREVDGIPFLDYMKAPDPFNPEGRLRMETQILFLVLPGVTLNTPKETDKHHSLGEKVQYPINGTPTKFAYFNNDVLREHGGKSEERPYWALMTRDVIEGSRGKTYAEQQALVTKQRGYDVPELLPASICIFMERIKAGKCIYGIDPLTYTRCKEQVEYMNKMYQTVVGGFAPAGLYVDYDIYGHDDIGVAALRKF